MENELKYEFLCELRADVGQGQLIPGSGSTRVIVPVLGGEFSGPRLNGKVLPFGADWLKIRPDGVGELDVRVTLQTDDNALIYAYYRGYLTQPAEMMRKVQAGEEISPDDYYFAATPVYETGAEKYLWLTRTVIVARGYLYKNGVGYKIYAIQ